MPSTWQESIPRVDPKILLGNIKQAPKKGWRRGWTANDIFIVLLLVARNAEKVFKRYRVDKDLHRLHFAISLSFMLAVVGYQFKIIYPAAPADMTQGIRLVTTVFEVPIIVYIFHRLLSRLTKSKG